MPIYHTCIIDCELEYKMFPSGRLLQSTSLPVRCLFVARYNLCLVATGPEPLYLIYHHSPLLVLYPCLWNLQNLRPVPLYGDSGQDTDAELPGHYYERLETAASDTL